MIDIFVNGKKVNLKNSMSVSKLVEELCISKSGIVIEHNREILEPAKFDNRVVNNGDEIEILTMVDGG